jgi:hypothetical protein
MSARSLADGFIISLPSCSKIKLLFGLKCKIKRGGDIRRKRIKSGLKNPCNFLSAVGTR